MPQLPFFRCRLLSVLMPMLSANVSAVVIRADVDDAQYRVEASEMPALVDLPGEGHGVLIAPQWVLTAAHAIAWQSDIEQVTLAGVNRKVARLVFYPGYQQPPAALLDQAMATWDWTLFRAFLAASDDIALIRLHEAVTDVPPVAIHRVDDEFAKTITIFGKGATGDGQQGYEFSDPHRTQLRRAQNRISSAHGRWLCYRFDPPQDALPLEGGSGSGDSGGPVLIRIAETWSLAGVTSWVDPQTTGRTPGKYGQISCNVRVSHYQGWIDSEIAAPP